MSRAESPFCHTQVAAQQEEEQLRPAESSDNHGNPRSHPLSCRVSGESAPTTARTSVERPSVLESHVVACARVTSPLTFDPQTSPCAFWSFCPGPSTSASGACGQVALTVGSLWQVVAVVVVVWFGGGHRRSARWVVAFSRSEQPREGEERRGGGRR